MESEDILFGKPSMEFGVSKEFVRPKMLPRDETEAARMIYHQMDLSVNFRRVPVRFVDTP